jgi:two-component system LytT family sensor kinase
LQSIAIHNGADRTDLPAKVYSYSSLYFYFVFHNAILYEKLFTTKRYITYVLVLLVTLFAWRESTSYFYWLMTRNPGESVYEIRELKQYNAALWVFIYWTNIIYVLFSLGVYLSFKYFKEHTRLLQVQNIQRELELKKLNEQLNPHFLFNALNNIYNHLLHQSSDGKELILKLSELMRYILDSSKKESVLLTDELMFIEHYIAFEKERLGDRCIVEYSKDVNITKFNIVPLILFNFIENAFKYGTTSVTTANIVIQVSANDNILRMFISNPVYPTSSFMSSTKTGMDNTTRRLDLVYADKYTLDVACTDDTYNVLLTITSIR